MDSVLRHRRSDRLPGQSSITQLLLGISLSELGSLLVPLDRFHIILGYPATERIHAPEEGHAVPTPRLGGLAIPFDGFNVVLGDPASKSIHNATASHATGVSHLGGTT